MTSFSATEDSTAVAPAFDLGAGAPVVQLERGEPRETFSPAGGDRKRALHIINGEHYAGAERVQDLLALRLPDVGYDVGFVCLKPGRFETARKSQSSPLYVASMRSRLDLRPATMIARLVKDGGYNLIHTHTSRSALLGSLASTISGVPLVHHIHSAATPETLRDLRDRIAASVERFGFRRADAVIAVSRTIEAYACQGGVPAERVTFVPNGVPTGGPLRDFARPEGDWTVGTVALFRERKGLEVLIGAVARGRAMGMPLRLRVVGPFETLEYEARMHDLAQYVGVADAIDWRGFREDIPAELAAMDMFVMPSVLREGLPMVLIEAMAAGVPIIGSRIDGVADVIRDGEDGLLVRPGDADDLASAIAVFVHGEVDVQALRASAYQRQVTRYSDHSMAAGVANVYASVLARRTSQANARR